MITRLVAAWNRANVPIVAACGTTPLGITPCGRDGCVTCAKYYPLYPYHPPPLSPPGGKCRKIRMKHVHCHRDTPHGRKSPRVIKKQNAIWLAPGVVSYVKYGKAMHDISTPAPTVALSRYPTYGNLAVLTNEILASKSSPLKHTLTPRVVVKCHLLHLRCPPTSL